MSKAATVFFWLRDKTRRYLVNRYIAFIISLGFYAQLLRMMGGLSGIRRNLLTEGPLLLCLYYALNSLLKVGRWAPYVAAFPIFLAYTAYDAVYIAYGNVFRVADFTNLPELLDVLPFAYKAVLLLILGVPFVLFLYLADHRKYGRVLALSVLAAILVATVELFPGAILSVFKLAGVTVTGWSDAENVRNNGRFTMLLYLEAKRRLAFAETVHYRNRDDYETGLRAAADYIKKYGNNRNIHLIVLESFVDPTLFNAVTYSMNPRHPDFAMLIGDGMGFSVSPVFGGGTAQTEFEALCGVPALHKLSSIEFNAFTSAAAGCMPTILAQAGYTTIASDAFKPNFYNATKAYTGIGFEEIYFPVEFARARVTYLSAHDVSKEEDFMFDGELFEQNLEFVAKRLRENHDRPMLNYVLSIYGHEPHDMNLEKRPLVLSMKANYSDSQLLRAANQHWYRTQAIAHYIRGLTMLDPNSLIIMVSDHLPPLTEGMNSYKKFRYLDNIDGSMFLNRILFVENGKIVRHETIHDYNIPSLIYDYLTNGRFCAEIDCSLSSTAREDKYLALMAHAVEPPSVQASPVQPVPSPQP